MALLVSTGNPFQHAPKHLQVKFRNSIVICPRLKAFFSMLFFGGKLRYIISWKINEIQSGKMYTWGFPKIVVPPDHPFW